MEAAKQKVKAHGEEESGKEEVERVENNTTTRPPEARERRVQEELFERLEVLFQSIRSNSRGGFEYPSASVVALETVLIRLYVEGPVRSNNVN